MSVCHLLGVVIPTGKGSSSSFAISSLQLDVERYLLDFIPLGINTARHQNLSERDALLHAVHKGSHDNKSLHKRLDTKSIGRMMKSSSSDAQEMSQTDEIANYLDSLNKIAGSTLDTLGRLLKLREAALVLKSAYPNAETSTADVKKDVSMLLKRVADIFRDLDVCAATFNVSQLNFNRFASNVKL